MSDGGLARLRPPCRAACVAAVAALLLSAAGCAEWSERANPASAGRADPPAETQVDPDAPPSAKTLYALARMLAAQEKHAEAEAVLVRIIREHPRFLAAYCDLAELRMRLRRVDDAMATLNAGLRLSPEDPVLLNNLGMCWVVRGDCDQALKQFRRAAAAAPQEARYRANMAVALGLMGRYDESLALFEQVLPPADAHYNLAVLCEARKDNARAAQEYRAAEALRSAARPK